METSKAILLRYGEVWLKSPHVRRRFEQVLAGNIRSLFPKGTKIAVTPGRIFVYASKFPKQLGRVFGITSYSPVYILEKNIGSVKSLGKELSKKWKKGSSFAIRASRTDKSFPLSSKEIEIAVANEIGGFPVDLSQPENRISIEVRDKVYVYEKEFPGPGGLPLGSGGLAIAMLRDEQDLAATWLMMKRGIVLIFVKPKKSLLKALGRWTIGRKIKTAKSLKEATKKNPKALVDVRESKLAVNGLIVLNPLAGWSEKELTSLLKTIR